MSGKRRWVSILLVATLAVLGLDTSAVADEGGFLSAINNTRASHGLGALTMDSGLRSYARKHTQAMMDADGIFHSSSSALRKAAGSGWTKIGENVGRGNTVSSLHQAFMDSPGHRANILGAEYNYVGIGTGTKDGVLYVTVVFLAREQSTTTTTTTKAPSTTSGGGGGSTTSSSPTSSSPTTTTTTTTLPPTTTTTLLVGPDRPVTPGESCFSATRYWWMCHD